MAKKIIIVLLVIIVLCTSFMYAFNLFLPIRYEDEVEKSCFEYGVKKELVYAVMKVESNFDENAVSDKNAKGLMQLTEDTAVWCAEKMNLDDFRKDMIYDPHYNIKIGVWYLSYLMEKTDSEDLSIIAYNAGINRVIDWKEQGLVDSHIEKGDSIPYPETERYLKKVKFYEKLYSYRTK